jgi:hypothetical protein
MISCQRKQFPVKEDDFPSKEMIAYEPMDFCSRKCIQEEVYN